MFVFNILTCFLFLLAFNKSFAQYDPETADRMTFRSKGFGAGVHISTTGIGGDLQYFRRISEEWEWNLAFRVASMSDIRENRIESLYSNQGGKDFIYDKANYCYNFTFLYGWQKTLFNLDPYNKLSVRTGLALGPTFAVLKPYYVDIAVPLPPPSRSAEVRSVPYDHKNMSFTDIVGESGFSLGTDELDFTPGLTFRWNVMFNMAGTKAKIRALNVGLESHYYFKKLRLMDENPNKNLYFSGFVSFLFGTAH